MAETIDTHGMLIDFGKHKGEPYTRAPIAYLRWMIDIGHSRKEIAMAELDRRGIAHRDHPVEISGHAVDTASLRLLSKWKELRKDKNEGLHRWLQRMCLEALEECEPDSEGRIMWHGIKLVFNQGELLFTLKTVMLEKKS